MKILVCGAGSTTDELLKRVSEKWEITVLEKRQERLESLPERFPSVVRVVAEDASSPVALERAGLARQDCLLALTDDDEVNLVAARQAREAGVPQVVALVRDPEMAPAFQELDVWALPASTVIARRIYQFLKDPRVRIIDLGEGEGELLEMEIGEHDATRFSDLGALATPDWRLVGIVREDRLLFPAAAEAAVAGDRLLFLGRGELYNEICATADCERPHFPRTYGQEMVLGLGGAGSDRARLLNEALSLAQGTHVASIVALYGEPGPDLEETLARWSESLQIEAVRSEGPWRKRLVPLAREHDAGLVVVPPERPSWLRALLGGGLADLARRLPCPLLVARRDGLPERVLVPFAGDLASQRALEIAIDLSQQIDAAVTAIVVVEPEFLHGRDPGHRAWRELTLRQVRELAHVHKMRVAEEVREGNPIRQIVAATAGHDLLVVGCPRRRPSLLSVDVAGELAARAACSVLLAT